METQIKNKSCAPVFPLLVGMIVFIIGLEALKMLFKN